MLTRLRTTRNAAMMNPIMRRVHAKLQPDINVSQQHWYDTAHLWCSMRFFKIIGKIVPPMLDPLAMQANASPRFLWNQCGTTPDAAVNTTPLPS